MIIKLKYEEKKCKNYKNIQKFTHNFYISSILFFEDKNKLISSGYDGTRFWNLNNYNNINLIKYFMW